MKFIIPSTIFLLNIPIGILPNASLLIVMGVTMALDFVTGITKAYFLDEVRTSAGYRKTIIKFIQYGMGIAIGFILKFLAVHDNQAASLAKYCDYLTNGLLIFIIFIEVTSILENICAMNSDAPIVKLIFKPALKIMIFEMSKNPIKKLADEQDKNNPGSDVVNSNVDKLQNKEGQ